MIKAFPYLLLALAFPSSALATVNVSSPMAGSTVSSPVHYVATASASTCASGVASMGIYVNNQLVYTVNGTSLNTSISMANGPEHTVLQEWDKCGGSTYTTINVNVGAPATTTGVTVTSPTAGSTVQSPVHYVASATTAACAGGVSSMGIYVNNKLTYTANGHP